MLWPKEEKSLQFKSQTCFLVEKDATKAFKDLFEYDQTLEEPPYRENTLLLKHKISSFFPSLFFGFLACFLQGFGSGSGLDPY
jgi:hypothetical protein